MKLLGFSKLSSTLNDKHATRVRMSEYKTSQLLLEQIFMFIAPASVREIYTHCLFVNTVFIAAKSQLNKLSSSALSL